MTELVVQEAATWLEANPPSENKMAWLEKLVDSGWAAPSWPKEWFGRGLSSDEARATDAVFRSATYPATSSDHIISNDSVFGGDDVQGWGQDVVNLWAATVASHAGDQLKRKVLRDLLLGRTSMCLLYSEPNAGSDLAGVRTSAVRDGDEWIVNGQKVWTSGGRQADYAFLIARTDLDQPKHRGLSFFFLPMKQTGVEVRPLRQATGDSRFNEVFLTDARVSNSNMLGALNEGWWVLTSALAYERAAMGATQRRRSSDANRSAPNAESEAPAPIPDLSLMELARTKGLAKDPAIRQQLVRLYQWKTLNEWNNQRAKAAIEQGTTTPIVSLGKLAMSRMLHFAGSLQARILGAEATLGGDTSSDAADATYSMLNAYFTSIGGGTDQIQRNIIGERILGLPKEPEIDKARPFREVLNANI
ncbi:MAG: acyl-CoA dehydrogenase family protein [Acidimicrobiales bacterium]|nr:acyl-CoA dehydrogenase family protein [Acidimicrobiales bacterium]